MAVFLCLLFAIALLIAAVPATEIPKPVGAMFKVQLERGHGSGVHIGNGFVLTAAHVVDKVKNARVKLLSDKGDVRRAEVLWTNTAYDIALLKAERWEKVRVSKLDCRDPRVGEEITARGNPLILNFVTTRGHVSSVHKVGGGNKWRNVFVGDITAQQGMSGGPVYDKRGALIGILVGIVGFKPGFLGPVLSQQFSFIVPASAVCGLIPGMK